MENNINIIYVKLEEFISRYHLFKIIKGSLVLFGLVILFILIQSLIEYFNYLGTAVKTVLFYSTVLCTLALLIYYFFIPFAALIKLRKPITYKKASEIISKFFPEIQDKLLNTLELGEILKNNAQEHELIVASINQKIETLNPLPFKSALNVKLIRNNIVFFGISIFILLIVFAFNSKVLTEGTVRFINYSKFYEPNAPFSFIIDDSKLICEKNKDFNLELKVEGDYLPENVYVSINGNSFLMKPLKKKGNYSFIFRNVNTNFEFKFVADNYKSKNYTLKILPAPLLKGFKMYVSPPSYTGIDDFTILNTGDCTVPAGSTIKWELNTLFVDLFRFIFDNDTVNLVAKSNMFTYSKLIRDVTPYAISFNNKYFRKEDNLKYTISVVRDEFPEIDSKQVEDSLKIGAFYFMVSIRDDYGFHNLNFVRNIVSNDSSKSAVVEKIEINTLSKNQDLFYYFDFTKLDSTIEDCIIEYYFEVRDNDYINNFKPARSSAKVFKVLDREEIRKNIDELDKERDNALAKSKKLTDDIQKQIEEFKKKELNNELSDWDKKNFLKNISDKQKDLDKFVKELIEKNKKENQIADQFYQEQKNIEEKQKQIQELLDQIMDDELEKLLEEIEKLKENFNPKDFDKVKDKLDYSYKNMEKKLDRSLELLKRYKVEENVMKVSEDLNKLSEKEHSLSEKLPDIKKNEELLDKQKQIKSEFEEIKKVFDNTIKENQDLKSPFDMDKFNKEFNELNENLEKEQNEAPGLNKKKIQKKMEENSKDMEELSNSLEAMMNEMEMQALEMNLGDLRQIIDNLSEFSFEQEENYSNTNKILQNNPAFLALISKQSKISNNFSVINDSINTLMEKVPQISEMLIKEKEAILYNVDKTNKLMEERNRREAMKFQRYILNSSNTLALYLEELKKQMEKQQKGSGGGKSKKGKQEEAMEDLKKQQKKLKQELEKLLEQMKKDQGKPDKGDNGEKSDQIVKTLAEQEIFNKMLKEMQNQQGNGPETDKKLKEIKKLSDQNIDDLINKNISPELINRNQKILSRLLDSEKAEKEREQEKKRESKEGVKPEMNVPEKLKESFKNDKKYRETLQKDDLNMKNYYKNLSNDYFHFINQ